MKEVVRIGTRGSSLALAQTRWTASELERRNPGLSVTWTVISTQGDRTLDRPLSEVGGKGLFVKEIEAALLRGEVDLAVHSLKDLPSEPTQGLDLHAVSPREDPRDALISHSSTSGGSWLTALAEGAVVGTSSLRRRAQLLHRRPDLKVVSLRGNVDTRLRKLGDGEIDACVLACAGLDRLGLFPSTGLRIPVEEMVPAPAQGALGIQGREDDDETRALASGLDDPAVRAAVTAERALMNRLQGSCQVPLGAHARPRGDQIELLACVASPDGSELLRAAGVGPASAPEALGEQVAADLMAQGAERILAPLIGKAARVD